MKVNFSLIAGMVLGLSAVFAAPVAQAAEVQVPETMVLHIDEGFLGHPVTLDLFDNTVQVSWGAGDVLAPGDMIVTRTSSTEISIEWSSSYVLGPKGIAVGFRLSTSSSPFDVAVVEIQKPFSHWRAQPTSIISGFASARIGAEGRIRLKLSPKGMRMGTATWYKYKQCNCAASPDFPKGTELLVRSVDRPEKTVVVRVNDYGPDRSLFPTRVIDLDAVAFTLLSPLSAGVIRVTVEPIPPTSTQIALN